MDRQLSFVRALTVAHRRALHVIGFWGGGDRDDTIHEHRGPLFAMSRDRDLEAILSPRGLSQDRSRCAVIRANMPMSPLELSPLLREGD